MQAVRDAVNVPLLLFTLALLVYGSIMVSSATPVDPTDLFIAGVVPGLFIGTLLAIYAVSQGLRFKIPREHFSRTRLWEATRQGAWSLLLPVIILGGIYSGILQPPRRRRSRWCTRWGSSGSSTARWIARSCWPSPKAR